MYLPHSGQIHSPHLFTQLLFYKKNCQKVFHKTLTIYDINIFQICTFIQFKEGNISVLILKLTSNHLPKQLTKPEVNFQSDTGVHI